MTIQMIHAILARPSQTETSAAAPQVRAPLVASEVDWDVITRCLRRYALALTGCQDEAEDLAQQTLAALLAKAPARADHLGYARRTLTRLWLDRQRAVHRRLKRWCRLATESVLSSAASASPQERHEQVAGLRRAIELLPPRQQAVITLRLIEGLEYEQIAEAIGSDVGAVRASLHLARVKMREALGKD